LQAEVGSFRLDQNTNVAFARVMNRLPKTFWKLAIDAVEGRIGKGDASDCALAAFDSEIIGPAETRFNEIVLRKAERMTTRRVWGGRRLF
jgi:hypothetical protein